MDFIQKLSAIQAELKAPKSQYNKFGGYAYRKAEDILEALKPLLHKYGCAVICTDELVHEGDRYYIRARASLRDAEGNGEISAFAYAREEAEKKGMDGSQVTGASSSYARKYALNGLFCIDDTADSDTTNQGAGDNTRNAVEPEKTSGRTRRTATQAPAKPAASPAPEKTSGTAKKVVTDKNIKQIVDWVCSVPEGPNREERIRKAEASYEWPGNLLEAFRAMVDLSE